MSTYRSEYWRKHREKLMAAHRRWYAKHKDEVLRKRRERYRLNPEPIRQQVLQYRKRNRDKVNAAQTNKRNSCLDFFRKRARIYYAKRRSELSAWMRDYRSKHRDKINAAAKKRRLDNLEEYKARARRYASTEEYKRKARKYQLAYRAENMDKIRAHQRAHFKKQVESKSNLYLANCIRARVFNVLRGKNKSAATLSLLGCSIEHLKLHLQSQFKPGMHWNNWSLEGWHIDHILPCARFDLSKPEEQRKCFHYTNLQPLWAKENLTKRDKVIP